MRKVYFILPIILFVFLSNGVAKGSNIEGNSSKKPILLAQGTHEFTSEELAARYKKYKHDWWTIPEVITLLVKGVVTVDPGREVLTTGIGCHSGGGIGIRKVGAKIGAPPGQEFEPGRYHVDLEAVSNPWMPFWCHQIYRYKVYFIPSVPVPPKQPILKDTDGDGVPDCRDLCPKISGKGEFGCPKNIHLTKCLEEAQKILREQIYRFAEACDIENAHEKSQKLRLVMDNSVTNPYYKNKTIHMHITDFTNFLRAELGVKCNEKVNPAQFRKHATLYHELGHFLADMLEVADVDFAGESHDQWELSHPGTAIDEARADLTMVLMSRFLKRPLVGEPSFDRKTASEKLGKYTKGDGNKIPEVITSFWLDILPKDPGKALKIFNNAQKEWQKYQEDNRPPQDIGDWLVGYSRLLSVPTLPATSVHDTVSLKVKPAIQEDQEIAKKLKIYKIQPDTGLIEHIDPPSAVQNIRLEPEEKYEAMMGWRKTGSWNKIIVLKSEPMSLKVYGSRVSVFIRTSKGRFKTHSVKTEYEVVHSEKGQIIVRALEGTVKIEPPDREPLIIREGEVYIWPEGRIEKIKLPMYQGVLDLSGAGEDWAREWEVLSTAKDFGGGGKAGFYPEAVRSGHAHPNPGRRGILYLHPPTQEEPARIARRVKLKGNKPTLRMGVTGNRDIDGDWALIVKVNDEPLEKEKIIAGDEGWQDLSFDLSAFSGQNVDIEIEARANNWYYEFVFFDYIQVAERAAEESERVLPTEGELAHAEVELTLLSTNKPYSSVDAAMISASGNRVVYVSSFGGNDAVMVVNSDGTGSTELFHNNKMTDPFDNHYKLHRTDLPNISGDGNTIAFPVTNRPGWAPHYLCVVNWDGYWKKPQIIKFDNLCDPDYWVYSVERPSISDDGSKIVVEVGFKLGGKYYSCIVSTDKHGRTPKSLLRFWDHETVKYYTWDSPVLISGNGERIIFNGKETDGWESSYVLWSMNSDGTNLKNINPSGAVPQEYSVPYYNISSDGKTAGFLANFPEADGWQYILVDARDGSNLRKIHTYFGESLVYPNYGSPQITPDARKVFYCFAVGCSFYRKNSDDTGDIIALDGNTKNLPWEYSHIIPGRGRSSGDQRFYMNRTGSRFLIIKEAKDLYLVQIKGEEAKLPPEKPAVPREDKDSDLAVAQAQVKSLQSDLKAAQSQIKTLQSDCGSLRSDYDKAKSDAGAAQAEVQTLKEKMARAKTAAEIINALFVPVFEGKEVDPVNLLFEWTDKIEATGDAVLKEKFQAVMDSEGRDQEVMDLFLYLFESIPKILE